MLMWFGLTIATTTVVAVPTKLWSLSLCVSSTFQHAKCWMAGPVILLAGCRCLKAVCTVYEIAITQHCFLFFFGGIISILSEGQKLAVLYVCYKNSA